MPGFIHDSKHGTSAISNHPVPLLSMTALISRSQSAKKRWLFVALTLDQNRHHTGDGVERPSEMDWVVDEHCHARLNSRRRLFRGRSSHAALTLDDFGALQRALAHSSMMPYGP
ncbi:hypothetical protein [Sinorhizobium meliloti]|uniref:hypothetical protein n=1 Tax=Rhizobium meliloti TaxID=382 RepID=UPI00299D652D